MTELLSAHTIHALRMLTKGPQPTQAFNPGTVGLLLRKGWALSTEGPAINKRAKPGEKIPYLKLSPEGQATISSLLA